ncbi:MAG: glycosyltransferase family 4 protein [bacterium]
MNILICTPCLLVGGTEIQTLNLVESLVLGGHKVTVLSYFEFDNGMVGRYRNACCDVICLNKGGQRLSGLRSILFLFKGLRRVVKMVKPEVVHVQYMAPGAIPIILLKLLGVKNIIATAHTAADIYPSLKLVHFIQRYCLRAFTCITKLAEESFFGSSQLYTPQTKLGKRNHFTIYNALSSHIAIREDKKVFSDTTIIGVVSRLECIKGMDLVVPAFAQLQNNYPATKLLIVGDGSQRELMESQADKLDVTSKIEFVGRQNREALEAYYDKIDILLMPSRSEGFGLTAIEGMARGCVVVASDVGGLPEVVVDKVGLLHKSEDVDSISDNITKLLGDRELLERLSANAPKYVTKFQFEHYSLLFNDLYNKLQCQ